MLHRVPRQSFAILDVTDITELVHETCMLPLIREGGGISPTPYRSLRELRCHFAYLSPSNYTMGGSVMAQSIFSDGTARS